MNLSEAFTQIGMWFAEHALRLLPAGGTTDQVLTKIDGTDYNVEWTTPSGGGGVNIIDPVTGDILPVTNLTIIPSSTSAEGENVTVFISTPPAGTNDPSTVLERVSGSVCAVSVDSSDPIDIELAAINFAAFPSLTQVGTGQGRFVTPLTFIGLDEPVTSGIGATIEARQIFAGFAVFGQMADIGSVAPFFYSGLKVSLMDGLNGATNGNYGQLARFAPGPTNQIVPSLRPLGPTEITYAEFTLGGTGARSGFRPDNTNAGDIDQLGETGSAVTFGFQVDPGDTSQLLVYSESTVVATLVGTGDLTTQRLGVLIDPALEQFWIAADGVFLTLIPGTDPGVSYTPMGSAIYFAASPAVSEPVNFMWAPSLITYATEATAAGATRIGWGSV